MIFREINFQNVMWALFIRYWGKIMVINPVIRPINNPRIIITPSHPTVCTLRWRYMSVMTSHITGKKVFVEQLVQATNTGNIKASHYWPNQPMNGGYPSKRATNAESVPVPLSHNESV